MLKYKFLVIFIGVFFFSGCATMFGNKNRTITISSHPPKANVEYNGRSIGTTPVEIVVTNTFNPGFITVSKSGYNSSNRQIQTDFQVIGILNVFFWPGFIIDAATGNMMAVNENHMNFVLQQK